MELSIKRIYELAIVTLFFLQISHAQISTNSELYQILKAKDSLFFEVGFNECHLEVFEQLLPEKFEFYHDKDGITTNRTVFISSLKENLCSSGKNDTKRVLEEGSMEVFPLYNNNKLYGAIQTGRHSFGSTVARFTNLWLLEDGHWLPTRIMSYDHKMNTTSIVSNVTFVKLTPSQISIYLGDYEFSPDFTLSIIIEGDKIYGMAQGQKVELKYYGNHSFLDYNETMKLIFILNEKNSAIGLKMISPDREMEAKKIIKF